MAMVANIIAAYRVRIEALTWMAPATKAEAEAKLNALYVGVGYPETWHSYDGYEVKPDDIFGNVWRAGTFHYHRTNRSPGKNCRSQRMVDDAANGQRVNLPLQDALNFPAAILQPPFFDAKAPSAVNYGAIGSVIGHEISHTFDPEGSTFDARGRLRDWWTPADLAHFDAATAKLAAQYDTYMPFPDVHVNGKQTLAEDIADVAGISAAYDGYRASLDGKPAPEQDGFSGDQQFFIAFGQNWGSKVRPAALRQSSNDRPACTGRISRRHSAKYRPLVYSLRCEARTDTVLGSSGSCSHLVRRRPHLPGAWLVPVLNVRPKGGREPFPPRQR